MLAVGIASWNTRALFHGETVRRHRKMQAALEVYHHNHFCGFQETHGSLPDAIEFYRLLGGPSSFAAWSAIGCEVIDFSKEELTFGSPVSSRGEKLARPFEGESDTESSESGVQSREQSESESATSDSYYSSSDVSDAAVALRRSTAVSNSSGGVFSAIKRETFSSLATCEHWAIVPGRCLVSEVSDGNKTTVFINMHFIISLMGTL